MKKEDFEDISLLLKIGTVMLIITTLLQIIGLASSHWALSTTTEFGTVEYSGLWEKCDDLSIGQQDFSCQGFVWEDVQVSHWFRTIQTMEVLGLVGLFVVIGLMGIYMFSWLQGKKWLKLLSVTLSVLCGVLIIVSCIVFGSLKDVMKARHMPQSEVHLSWGFVLSLLSGLGSLACGIVFCIG